MSIAALKELADHEFAKDTKINIGRILSTDGSPDLSETQIAGIALASAYATRHDDVIDAAAELDGLTDTISHAAKAAATIMAMNNIYYRFTHLVDDAEYGRLPAGLRMTVIANPGIDKVDFELMSLAVSAINGCGMCMASHAKTLENAGVSKQAIQSAVRIAAVLNAVAQADYCDN